MQLVLPSEVLPPDALPARYHSGFYPRQGSCSIYLEFEFLYGPDPGEGSDSPLVILAKVWRTTMRNMHLVSMFAISGALIAASGPAQAQAWTTYSDSDFPAKVQAVVFANGVTFGPGNTMEWGKWKVSFGPSSGAYIVGPYNGGFKKVEIRSLECSNPVAGQIPCKMMLAWHPEGARLCELQSEDIKLYHTENQLGESATITQITCPMSMTLQQ